MTTFSGPRKRGINYTEEQWKNLTVILIGMLVCLIFSLGVLTGVLLISSHQEYSRNALNRQLRHAEADSGEGGEYVLDQR